MGKKSRKKKQAASQRKSRESQSSSSPMKNSEQSAESPPVRSNFTLVAQMLLVVALGITCYLTWVSLTQDGVAACGEGASCGAVLKSKWAKVWGIPTGLIGFFTYLGLLFTAPSVSRGFFRLSSWLGLFLMMMIILAATWFAAVQIWILKAFCPWCCSAHLCATVAVSLIFWVRFSRQKKKNVLKRPKDSLLWNRWPIPTAAVGSLALVIAIQANSEEPETVAVTKTSAAQLDASENSDGNAEVKVDPNAPRFLSLHEGQFKLDVKDLPIVGEASASYVMVTISDYSCGHCRKLQGFLKEVQKAHGDDQLAIVQLPGFKNQKSMEIARIVLPLWKVDQKLFKEIEEKLYAGTIAFNKEAVLAAVYSKMGGEATYVAMTQPHQGWTQNLIYTASQLFHKNSTVTGRKVIPHLMAGDEILVGASNSANRYYKLANQHFGLADLSAEDAILANQEKKKPEPEEPKGLGDGLLVLHESDIKLNALELPVMGSPRAEHLTGFLFDYTCLHCSALHETLRRVRENWAEDELGIILVPGVRNAQSEQLHRIMLAVWKSDEELYHQLSNELLGKKISAQPESLREVVRSRLGAEKFAAAEVFHREWIDSVLLQSRTIYQENAKAGKQGFPQLIAGKEVSVGRYPKDFYYESLFKRQFGLELKESAPVRMATTSENREEKVLAQPEKKSVELSGAVLAYVRNGTKVSYFDPLYEVDSSETPIFGSPEAEDLTLVLLDYQQESCRSALQRLIKEQDPQQQGIVILSAMPNGNAQKIHRSMLLLWRHDQEVYRQLTGQILAGEVAATPEVIKAKVQDLLGSEKIEKFAQQNQKWMQGQLVTSHRLYAAAKKNIANQGNLLPLLFRSNGVKLDSGEEVKLISKK